MKRHPSTVTGSPSARAASSAPTKPELHITTSPIDASTIAVGPRRLRGAPVEESDTARSSQVAARSCAIVDADDGRRRQVCTTAMGSVVGASEPPSGSTVTPTATPASISPSSSTAVLPPAVSKTPALRAPAASMYQAW